VSAFLDLESPSRFDCIAELDLADGRVISATHHRRCNEHNRRCSVLCISVKGCIDPTAFVSQMSISPTITTPTPGYPDFTPRNRPIPSSADALSTGPKQKLLFINNRIYIKEFVSANSTLTFQSFITTAHLAHH